MDAQLEKYKLVEWLIGLKDEAVISKLKKIKNDHVMHSDWVSEISENEKLLIEAGLKDLEEGKTYTHEQVLKEIKETYGL